MQQKAFAAEKKCNLAVFSFNISFDDSNSSIRSLPNLPIYKLLKAFNLQQYTLKLVEKGYGSEVFKLALLTGQGREDLVEQL